MTVKAGTESDVTSRLAGVVREFFGCSDLVVTRKTSALDIDGWDSLSHTLLLLQVESEFGVRFPAGRTASIATVGDLADLIEALASAKS